MSRFLTIVALLLVAGLLAACGSGEGDGLVVLGGTTSPSPSASVSPSAGVSGSPTAPMPSASPSLSPSDSPSTSPSASASPSPSASTTTGSASPSPSPSASLDPVAELEAYLLQVKAVRAEVYRVYDRCEHAAYKVAHHYADATWPKAARMIAKEVRHIARVRVRYDLIVPPASLTRAHSAFSRDMKVRQIGWEYVAEALKYKKSWNESSPMGRKIARQFDRARALNDAWAHDIKVEAKRLGLKVPWKWHTYKL